MVLITFEEGGYVVLDAFDKSSEVKIPPAENKVIGRPSNLRRDVARFLLRHEPGSGD